MHYSYNVRTIYLIYLFCMLNSNANYKFDFWGEEKQNNTTTTTHITIMIVEYLGGESADQEVGLGQEVDIKDNSS